MKVFLTGGTGFIGSYILMDCLKKGHEVTALARNVDKIPALHNLDHLQLVQGSMLDFDIIKQAIVGVDVCIHVALNYNDQARVYVWESCN